jgi:hypothetical protein
MEQKYRVLTSAEIQKRAQSFVSRWKDEKREEAESQTWWNEFLEVFGLDRKDVAVFQMRAKRASTANTGKIDVFMPGVFLAEHKSLGKDKGSAITQAEDYLVGGDIPVQEMPQYVITTDFNLVTVRDLLDLEDSPQTFNILDLSKNAHLFAFLSGYRAPLRKYEEQAQVTISAARQMGRLYEVLLGDLDASEDDEDSHDAAIFMTRLLFLMYGDDSIGLWDRHLFLRFIREATVVDGSDTGSQIAALFQVLDTPSEKRSEKLDGRLSGFPYVNGGIFSDRIRIPAFDSKMRAALLEAMQQDWSGVSPAILGSLFQGISSKEQRREKGEHYTTEENILRLLRPLFLDELESKLKEKWNSIDGLNNLRQSLSGTRILDPACGSGNFLIVAYRELRDFELRILVRLKEMKGQTDYQIDGSLGLVIRPENFAGIEVGWWPARIAETAMFLIDHQCNQKMADSLGSAPNRLPIKQSARIVHSDALKYDWESIFDDGDIFFVIGNPPFHGTKERSEDDSKGLELAWGHNYTGNLDYVTGWHAKAIAFLASKPNSRFAFVTTNSVTQGRAVRDLFDPIFSAGWRIRFAYRSLIWTSEASGKAGVHVVIIGFDKEDTQPLLFVASGKKEKPIPMQAKRINGYLLDYKDVYADSRTVPLGDGMNLVTTGSSAIDWGQFGVDAETYEKVCNDPIVSKYLRRFMQGRDLIHNTFTWILWLKDISESDLKASSFIRARVENIQQLRKSATRVQTQEAANSPTLFGEDRQPSSDFLAFPQTFSENREFLTVARLPKEIIIGQKIYYADDPDGFQFSIASTSMMMAWQLTVGGKLKSDPSFSNTLVWNTFPLPKSEMLRMDIIQLGREVLSAREAEGQKNLASLYNPLLMPKALRKAHQNLDKAVDSLFGLSNELSLWDRQICLLKRYESMSTQSLSRKHPKP